MTLAAFVGMEAHLYNSPNRGQFIAQQTAMTVGSMANLVTGLLALGWFGAWMGLTSRSAAVALLKTLFYTKVVPWIALSFLKALAFAVIMIGNWSEYGALLLNVLPDLGVNLALLFLARHFVLTHFRTYAAVKA
jgi:hypothetical protein